MAAGLTQYVVFRRNLGTHGRDVPNPLPRSALAGHVGVVVAAVAVIAVVAAHRAGQAGQPVAGDHRGDRRRARRIFRGDADQREGDPVERTRVRAFIPLFIANAVFWSLFQQIFTVLAVYSDERMNWSVFGWTAPSSWIGSIEPVWIIVLSPRFRDHVDAAGQSRTDHAAQVRLWRDRDGARVPAVPADGGHHGQGGAGVCWSPASWRCSRSPSCCCRRSGCRSPQSLRRRRFGLR